MLCKRSLTKFNSIQFNIVRAGQEVRGLAAFSRFSLSSSFVRQRTINIYFPMWFPNALVTWAAQKFSKVAALLAIPGHIFLPWNCSTCQPTSPTSFETTRVTNQHTNPLGVLGVFGVTLGGGKIQVLATLHRAMCSQMCCRSRSRPRYNAAFLRQRFDKNADIKDLRIAKQLLQKGEDELFRTQHPIPKKFAVSPGGVAYAREVILPDWIADYWHPSEKAMYPKYFARRELRKKEYLEWYDKQYPDAKNESHHH